MACTRSSGKKWWSASAGTFADDSSSTGLQRPSRSWQRSAVGGYGNGSFVTAKDEPGDFDACWDPDGVDLDALNPVLLDLSGGRSAQKERFGGDLFPNVTETGSGLVFAEFFRNERDTGRKGIVVLRIGGQR